MEQTPQERKRSPRGVQSIETGGVILGVLSRARGPLKLRDLAEETGIAPAQLHPYLVSFRKMELVEQNEAGHYQLGPFALHLGLTRLRNQNAFRETVRRAATLADELQLMIAITVWGLHGPTIVYVHESSARIHANVQVGNIFMLTITATGKTFAAFLPASITRPMIETERTDKAMLERAPFPFDESRYRAEVAEVGARGYAVTRDMPIPGISAVAAPVFDHTEHLQLVITAIGPTHLIDLSEDGPDVSGLLAFTRNLSRELGYRHLSAEASGWPPAK